MGVKVRLKFASERKKADVGSIILYLPKLTVNFYVQEKLPLLLPAICTLLLLQLLSTSITSIHTIPD